MLENKSSILDNFTNVYPVSKTLRFELRPVGKTEDYIKEHGVLEDDLKRAKDYKEIKKIIDRYHKQFIDEVLKEVRLQGLDEYYRLYGISKRNDSEEKQFVDIQTSLRKQISESFKTQKQFDNLFGENMIKKILMEYTKENAEEQTLIKSFANFTTYFVGFHQNRKNMYSGEDKSTAIAYRIVHQNLPKYIDNMKVFSMLQKTGIDENIPELIKNLQSKIGITSIDEYFVLDGFNKVLSQKGIDDYNTILAGFPNDEKKQVQGLNGHINLYNQKNKEKFPKFKPLFKQILSDREKMSFMPEQFASDSEVIQAVNDFYEQLRQTIFESESNINIGVLLFDLSSYDLDKIYLKNDNSITSISQWIFSDWAVIRNAIVYHYDAENSEKSKKAAKYAENREKALSKVRAYSIGELNSFVDSYRGKSDQYIEDCIANKSVEILNEMQDAYSACAILHDNDVSANQSLQKNKSAVSDIKYLLDAIKKLQWLIRPLLIGQEESDKDEVFYAELIRIWKEIDTVTLLYDKVRNYITKKPYSLEKFKLNFNNSTLMNGWDQNKEKDYLGIILEKDGLYYLGIMNKKHNKVIDEAPKNVTDKVYKKMEYKQLRKVNANMPRIFLKDKWSPSKEMLEKYEKGTHLKGKNFKIDDCRALIDFFKKCICQYDGWQRFHFNFSETDSYEDISGFYKEFEKQAYNVTFKDIDEQYIDNLVNEGKLYLFKIYNKDFSPYSKGIPNLHTLYWKMLFSPENLQDAVYKLDGNAEIFYRKASIKPEDIICHKANQALKNRDPLNGKKESVFPYDLIKDKRFTCDKYQFHVPLTMNFQANGETQFNRKVNRAIHDAEDMHIIGIDRGERNLLYLCLIDMQGKIVKQMSLNQIITYGTNQEKYERDYHKLLTKREEDNNNARQSWKTIRSIKELKAGYLSQVIHVITDLMIEYNAIVVLEDLNSGFKRSRQKVESQVYQKFEKMLIDKLNYLVDKKKNPGENGGLFHAYQLADKFENFQKLGRQLGKQSGFLFYIPAWNTSKLDPTTGFANLFYTKYESIEKSREFIKKFDSITFNANKGYFEFSFDYSKFTYKAEGSRLNWTVCSKGKRIATYRNSDNKWNRQKIDLTEEMKKLLNKYDIIIPDGDLRETMAGIEKKDFYERFMQLFGLMVQMRNSDTDEDKLISPVANSHGEFFETGCGRSKPLDADANGAYNIARKGLWVIEQIKNTDMEQLDKHKLKLAISNKEWLKYAQEHTL